ncbi:hypothetical protein D0T12_20690 [Actinomadura spongiicola]|uniref:Uncharacterized protein n=1 Tax=Actinomadura spongiicola TaxID=2303421 RepID=A0A372GDK8_9ACTN|nr:hypothetical protein [Actinomadura spongiicola]RFS83468.1 hypothetical protein D0T12_20690 [Actinomadura spongiicola]
MFDRENEVPADDTGPRCADESALAMALTTVWMLRTGRLIDRRPLLHELSAEELVEFWDDPFAEPLTKTAGAL